MPATPQDRRKPADHLVELKDLVIGYAKQETVDPLKSLKRYLLWGVPGAFLVAAGSMFLLLGTVRGMQSFSPFQYDSGALSLVPYVVAIAVGTVIIVLSILAIVRDGRKEDPS